MPDPITTQRACLDEIASADGTFAVLAMDQRNTLKRMYAAVGVTDPAEEELVAFKADKLRALAGSASAFLLDPTYGVPALRSLQGHDFGVLVAAEPPSRGNYNGEPRALRLPEQDAEWVRSQGGDALKFLVQLRADRSAVPGEPDLSEEALAVIAEVVADCRAAGVPSVVENLVYPLPQEEELTPQRRADAIIEAARALDQVGPDLLKLEYPGSPEACRRLAESISRPWAVLSAGVSFEEFSNVLRISCDEGGASGFIAGRAVWKEAVGMDAPTRQKFLAEEGRRRLDGLVAAIDGRARPWREATGA
jgi:tagatose-1,6-bisphosphate aldolase